ncbi:MAG: UDP-3-O-(3-hydroxymyristoyl)glucosamine N-acyltransferase [Planctomycetaceae bacterium]
MAKLGDLCAAVGGKLLGPPGTEITGVSSLAEAGSGDLAPVDSDKYLALARDSKASAFIVEARLDAGFRRPHIRVPYPLVALNRIIEILGLGRRRPAPGIHPTALVDPAALLAADVSIGPFCVVSAGVRIGRATVLASHVHIEHGVVIGEECDLAPGAVLCEGVTLRNRVKIGAHAVLGRPGFGYVPGPEGPVHILHVGRVLLEDDVHIGAGSAVDRARYGVTRLSRHVKLDNLVQVGHNCVIGERTLLCGQTGVAGSVRIGNDCQVGGQVGIGDHTVIGDRVRIGAQSGVFGVVEPDQDLFGTPARPRVAAMREQIVLRRLGEKAGDETDSDAT